MAVLVLAVGIGPLHGESKPGQLASVYAYDRTRPDSYRGVSYPAYEDIRDRGQVFAEVAGLTVTMGSNDTPRPMATRSRGCTSRGVCT